MGNLQLLSLDNEEDLSNLFLEFSWLEESGELIKESRISFDFKVFDQERKCYEIYKFFGGLDKFSKIDHGKELDNGIEKLDSPALNFEHNIFFNETLSQNSLKYFPSLNGMFFEKNEDNIMNKILSVIEIQRNTKNSTFYPNIIFYEQANKSKNYIYFKRVMWESTIKDKLDELPKINLLNNVLKNWLEFQSLISIVQLHSLEIFHGNIKTENMLVNHFYTVKITDISPWKPVFIDSSDLRFWTIFFEDQNCNARSNVLSCNLSPERFLLEIDTKNIETELKCEIKNKLFSMDIFSLGCVLNEIENEESTFTINEILQMSKFEKYCSNVSKVNNDWIREIFLNYNWEKRPDAFGTLLKLLNMNKIIQINSLNAYLFSHLEKKKFNFCKSFPLFFYPLSIIMQNKMFSDLRIQVIILNIILPIFLELFIIKNIYANNIEPNKKNICFEEIFSNLKIEYTHDWDLNKLKSTFQNKFDNELMKDLILSILISDLNHQIFDEKTKLENINSNNYSNIKGFFSIFQLLLNFWDNKKAEFSEDFNLTHYINYIILDDNFQLNDNYSIIQKNRKSFFALIKKNNSYIEDYNSASALYLHFINISLRRLTHLYACNYDSNNLNMFEIYNSIYLLSINTLNILLEILSEEHKQEIAVKEILPTLIQFLSNSKHFSKDSCFAQYQLRFDRVNSVSHSNDLPVKYNYKEPIVIFEIFNFINSNIMKYVKIQNEELVVDEINKIINDLLIINIEKWIYHYVTLNDSLVNSALKKLIVKRSVDNMSILFKILDYFLLMNKTEVFISEIFPYLIDQLNDKDINVKYEFCKLIIHIMEKMEMIFILPYGKFCIEKCLGDKEFIIKLIGLRSANKIFNRIIFVENKLGINESEIIIHELIESIDEGKSASENYKMASTVKQENNQIYPPTYTELILYTLPCLVNKLSLNEDFEQIVFILSLIQKEAKYNIRKQFINDALKLLTRKKIYNQFCEPDFKKPLPIIRGKYLGSIYNHSKLISKYDNNTNIGNGFNIYQKLLYINEEIYSCSTNNSINAGIYLHKLNVHDKLHYWNLITDQLNNYIFKFNNNSYVTSMMTLSNEFSIITGNNIGILSKINIDTSITVNEHSYKNENLLFKEYSFLNSKSPIIIFVGKMKIYSKELIISAYSNGDIYFIESESLQTEISFSIPLFLGSVIDYSVDNNSNDHLISFATDENIVIIIDLFYLKSMKIWKIDHELRITNIGSSNINDQSSKILLNFNRNGVFALFDPISGEIDSNVDFKFRITEIKEKFIHIHRPFLFSSKMVHTDFKSIQKCNCLYCQTQRVRIFGNYLNQYLIMSQYHNTTVKKERLINRNIIGPFSTTHNFIGKGQYANKYYIFNDEIGNVYQQSFLDSNLCYKDSFDCIISKYSTQTSLIGVNNENKGHKDLITSISIYSFSNDEIGLLTSSRDGIISYWN
ncbi:hypothetical protein ChUKH1_07835 [Cryptosporidium hominis]|nr:putative serine/threonine-protein kinase VPS15 [Cryptosporidium hominis]PPA63435.1 hypothetical protein ChUKH1_07835 [Cryptosporidium hominis]